MSEERTPLHVTGEVLSVKKIGAYRHLTLVAPGIADRYRPGTFVAVSVGHTQPRGHHSYDKIGRCRFHFDTWRHT